MSFVVSDQCDWKNPDDIYELASQLVDIVDDYVLFDDDGHFTFSDSSAELLMKAANGLNLLAILLGRTDRENERLAQEKIELEDALSKAEQKYFSAVAQLRGFHPCAGCKHCNKPVKWLKQFNRISGQYFCPHYFEPGTDPDQDCYEFSGRAD